MSNDLTKKLRKMLGNGFAVAGQALAEIERLTALVTQLSRSESSLPAPRPDSVSLDLHSLIGRESALTNKFIDDYVFDDGETAPHTPSEEESILIADAIHSLLADEEWSDARFAWEAARRAARSGAASPETATPAPALIETSDRVSDLKIALDLARQASADGRRAGRAEALALLTNLSAEDFPEDFIGEEESGGTGELNFFWRSDKLLALFDLEPGDSTLSLIDRISGAWWEQENTIDQLRDRIKRGPRTINTVDEFFAEARLLDLRADELAPQLALRPEFAAEVAAANRERSERAERT